MNYVKLFEEWNKDVEYNLGLEKNYHELIDLLRSYNLPLDEWGKGEAKTIHHLYNEIKEGETILKEENNELVRYVNFVGARIIYKSNTKTYRLYEEKQVFKDGRIRKRKNMPYSMAEKFKLGEDPKKVIIRGMKEELGISISKNQFTFYNKMENYVSGDYPGLKSVNSGYEFLIVLNDNQYNPDGYIEKQADKDVYFTWKEIYS